MSKNIQIVTTYKSGRVDIKESKLNTRFYLTKKDQAYVDSAKKTSTVEKIEIIRERK